jgi:hypothetical protein
MPVRLLLNISLLACKDIKLTGRLSLVCFLAYLIRSRRK